MTSRTDAGGGARDAGSGVRRRSHSRGEAGGASGRAGGGGAGAASGRARVGARGALASGIRMTAVTAVSTPRDVFEVGRIRRDFPILSERVHGKPLGYLDDAAVAQK